MIYQGKKLSHRQIIDLEKKQAFELLEKNRSENYWEFVSCSVTGLTITEPSKTNVAHIVSKGSNCSARFDLDNLIVVDQSIHDIMDNQGSKSWEYVKHKLSDRIKSSPELVEKVRIFFEQLPSRIEIIKSRYKDIIK